VKTIETRIAEAEAALAAGFASEAARRDAMTYLVGRIYEDVARELPYDTNFPYQLINWRAKHSDALRSNFAPQVKIIERLVALRDAMKVAALIAKPKSATARKNEAKLALAKTCQICGRPIFAETGVIAHHGYTRPGHGYQTGSCIGARELPFEVSRDRLGSHLISIAALIERFVEARGQTAREECPVHAEYARSRNETATLSITRETYATVRSDFPQFFQRRSLYTFDAVLEAELHRQDGAIKNEQDYLKHQQRRFDAWTPKP